jgi:hypothetical protein
VKRRRVSSPPIIRCHHLPIPVDPIRMAASGSFESNPNPSTKHSKEAPPPSVSSLRNRFEQGSRSNSSKSMHQVMKRGGPGFGQKGGSAIVKSPDSIAGGLSGAKKGKTSQPVMGRGVGVNVASNGGSDGDGHSARDNEAASLTITFSGPSNVGEKRERGGDGGDSLVLSVEQPQQRGPSTASCSESSVAVEGKKGATNALKSEESGTVRTKRRPMSMYSSVGRTVSSGERQTKQVSRLVLQE